LTASPGQCVVSEAPSIVSGAEPYSAEAFGARRTLPAGAISASAAYVWTALAQGGALIPGMIAPQALLGISFAMLVAGMRRSV
jgi:hypothetical protein